MESLRQQIDPYLTAVPDPNQTFQQYIQQLLAASPAPNKGFSSAFTGAGQQATQSQSSGQASSPTTSITDGLFSKYITEGGAGGESPIDGTPFGSGGSDMSGGRHSGTPSAADVLGAAAVAEATKGKGSTFSDLGGLLFGLPGAFIGAAVPALAQAYDTSQFNAFNRGIDASMGAFNDAGMLGGLGTFSDPYGNVGTFTNQGLIDAYDAATFGTTGAGLAAQNAAQGWGYTDFDGWGMGSMNSNAGGGYDSGGYSASASDAAIGGFF